MTPEAWTDLGAFILIAARFITAVWLFTLALRSLWGLLAGRHRRQPGFRAAKPSRPPATDLARVVSGSGDGGFYASIVAGRLRGILRDKLRLERGLSEGDAARAVRDGHGGLPDAVTACAFEDSLEKRPDEHFTDAARRLLDALDLQDNPGASKETP